MEASGMDVFCQKSTDKPTGQCVCLVNDKDKSLITDLGASADFTVELLKEYEKDGALSGTRIAYSAGSFVMTCLDAMGYVASKLSGDESDRMPGDETRIFCTSFSPPFICAYQKDRLCKILEFSDMIICNDSEILHWAK